MQGDSGSREGLTRVGLVAQNKEGDSVSRTEAKTGNDAGALYKSPTGQGLEGKALTPEPECPPSPRSSVSLRAENEWQVGRGGRWTSVEAAAAGRGRHEAGKQADPPRLPRKQPVLSVKTTQVCFRSPVGEAHRSSVCANEPAAC